MAENARRKVAIVLFNLGGPDSPKAVQPFLFNLFNDPAIIRVPTPLRWLIAKLISSRRAPVAREIYANLGGRSPLVPETEAQGAALERLLAPEMDAKCFLAMRYWHPFADEAAEAVKAWGADEIVLLPLYPLVKCVKYVTMRYGYVLDAEALIKMNNNWFKYKNIIIYKEDNVLGRCVFRDIF